MRFMDWLSSLWLCGGWGFKNLSTIRRTRRRAAGRWQRFGQVPALESLEPRTVPAVITVTSLADTLANDGQTTLREAIQAANSTSAADTIQFASSLTASGPATIVLNGNSLDIQTDLSIVGPGADRLAIDGAQANRVFFIDDSNPAEMKTVILSGLTVTNGSVAGSAGAESTTRRI